MSPPPPSSSTHACPAAAAFAARLRIGTAAAAAHLRAALARADDDDDYCPVPPPASGVPLFHIPLNPSRLGSIGLVRTHSHRAAAAGACPRFSDRGQLSPERAPRASRHLCDLRDLAATILDELHLPRAQPTEEGAAPRRRGRVGAQRSRDHDLGQLYAIAFKERWLKRRGRRDCGST